MKTIILGKDNLTEKIIVNGDEDMILIGMQGGSAEIEMVMKSENSHGKLYGILIGTGDQIYTIKTVSDHESPNANSRVHIKSVLMDNSKLDYEGMIRIQKQAQLSDAYLKNDNLIIGDGAVVNSSPQLEIAADDVKASHGVTISNVNDIEMFYLMSRGLTESDARKMLIAGFLNELLGYSEVNVDIDKLVGAIE
jgi:Fe-S cluster assembly protein SufD